MKHFRITGRGTGRMRFDVATLKAPDGMPSDMDAWNTVTQVLRHRAMLASGRTDGFIYDFPFAFGPVETSGGFPYAFPLSFGDE